MGKKIRKILAALCALCIAIVLVLSFSYGYFDNLDSDVDGFAAMSGLIRLNLSIRTHVKLTDEPLKFLVTDWESSQAFVEEYFDCIEEDHEYMGVGIKGGIKYKYLKGPFSRWYRTVTITELQDQ